MDVVNFDTLKAQGRILDLADVDPNEDYLIIGKYTNKYTTDNFKYTKYPIYAIKAGDVLGVQSVTGLDTDNTDPLNPVVNIAVDGTTITGQGTPASPLVAVDPRPYKVYTALLTQTGTNAPVANILENTLSSTPIWTRIGVGQYKLTLNGEFTPSKLFIPPYSSNFNSSGNASVFLPISTNGNPQLGWLNIYNDDINGDWIELDTYDMVGRTEWSSLLGDGNLPIEIRVYN